MTDEEGLPTAAPDVVEGHEVHEPEPEPVEPEPVAEQPEPYVEPVPEPGSRRRGLLILCILFGLAAFGFAVIAAVSTQQLDEQDDDEIAIRGTADKFADALLTYDYQDLDGAKNRVLALSTGNFRKEYEQAFEGGLDVLFRETKARSEGEVKEIFIGPIDDQTVTVIAVVDAVSVGTAGRRRLASSYVQLQLVKVGGEWKVDGVTNLNLAAPTSDLPLPTTTTTAAPK